MLSRGPASRADESAPDINLSALQASALMACVEGYALTSREKQIVLMVLHGMSNKEIASSISIAEQTVKDHLKHVYGKTGVHQRTALCAKLLGIVPPTSQPR